MFPKENGAAATATPQKDNNTCNKLTEKNAYSSPINYIKLINWAWQFIPSIEGCKTHHIVLFLAIVDRINNNYWNPTPIPHGQLVRNTKISKRIYFDTRSWLERHQLIRIQPGKNAIQMALFNLGQLVRNETSRASLLVNNETSENAPVVHIETGTSALGNRSLVRNETHYINSKTDKPIYINIEFDEFWRLYDKKVGNQNKMKRKWEALSDTERERIKEFIPKYKLAQPDKKFRKNPETFLNNKSWNDELIPMAGNKLSISKINKDAEENWGNL